MIPPTREQLEDVFTFLPDDGAGTRALLSQTIADFAYGITIPPHLLSERLSVDHMIQHRNPKGLSSYPKGLSSYPTGFG